jgi:hypothetical protein
MRREPSPGFAELAEYQRVLDGVYERSRALIADAPTWQAGLYRSVLACYAEMRSNPGALRLHFVTTMRDAGVLETRTRHRERLLELLSGVRDDAPERLHAEFLLNMVHASMRAQIEDGAAAPDLDVAEQTFAAILWRGVPVSG